MADERKRLIARAQALYACMPDVGFTRETFVELGDAANARREWAYLSPECKRAIIVLVNSYEEAAEQLRATEAEEVRNVKASDPPAEAQEDEDPGDPEDDEGAEEDEAEEDDAEAEDAEAPPAKAS